MACKQNLDLSYLQFVYNATESASEEVYDYIVVGGGTAGCPLATTLSANYSILLLERGGVAFNNLNVLLEENEIANLLQADDIDSPGQAFTSEDGILNARGRVLGGTSMINFGFYSRADKDFYNESGIEWNMDIVKSAYEWVEEAIVTKSYQINSWQMSVRRALLQSGIRPDNGLTLDHLQGTKIGGSTFDRTGRRHGAVELLNKAKKKNLRVVIHATVERVIFASNTSIVKEDLQIGVCGKLVGMPIDAWYGFSSYQAETQWFWQRLYCLRKHLKGEANVIEQVAIVTSESAIWNCDIKRWPPWRRNKARGRVSSTTSAPQPQITRASDDCRASNATNASDCLRNVRGKTWCLAAERAYRLSGSKLHVTITLEDGGMEVDEENLEEPNERISLFRHSHWRKDVRWINPESESRYKEMIELKIEQLSLDMRE
ncbi:hypothetical protein LguiA_002873 [Lonicera macranthoides]